MAVVAAISAGAAVVDHDDVTAICCGLRHCRALHPSFERSMGRCDGRPRMTTSWGNQTGIALLCVGQSLARQQRNFGANGSTVTRANLRPVHKSERCTDKFDVSKAEVSLAVWHGKQRTSSKATLFFSSPTAGLISSSGFALCV